VRGMRSGGDAMLVGLRVGLKLEGDFDGVAAIGFEEGLGLGLEDESDDVGSVERVARLVDFVGDSTGGGKSLG
jgi:hypothetical protein